MKWSLDQLQHICNELKDEKEIDIMKKYANNARHCTAIFICKKIYLAHVVNNKN